MYIMYTFYIYVRVLILMLKKKRRVQNANRNNEKYEFIRLFRITSILLHISTDNFHVLSLLYTLHIFVP